MDEDNGSTPLEVGFRLSDMVESISVGRAVRRRSYKDGEGSEYNLNTKVLTYFGGLFLWACQTCQGLAGFWRII